MKWIAIAEHTYYTENDPETDRPCIGYVKGKKYSLLLDAGNSAAHGALLQKGLKEAGLPLPDFIALTHAHWDHTYGLSAWKGLSIAGEKTNMLLKEMAAWKWDDEAMQKRLETGADSEFCDFHIRREYPDRSLIQVEPAKLSFSGELELDLGGISCFLRQIASPHAEDCVLISIPQDGLLFLGDAYCSVPVGEEWVYEKKLLGDFIALLEKEDFRIAVKGHHPPQSKEELLAELREEWEKLSKEE